MTALDVQHDSTAAAGVAQSEQRRSARATRQQEVEGRLRQATRGLLGPAPAPADPAPPETREQYVERRRSEAQRARMPGQSGPVQPRAAAPPPPETPAPSWREGLREMGAPRYRLPDVGLRATTMRTPVLDGAVATLRSYGEQFQRAITPDGGAETAARGTMDHYGAAFAAGGAGVLVRARTFMAEPAAIVGAPLTPTIRPSFAAPSAAPGGSSVLPGPAPTAPAQPAPQRQSGVSGRLNNGGGNVTIQQAIFQGVQNVDQLHRQIASRTRREADEAVNGALHDIA